MTNRFFTPVQWLLSIALLTTSSLSALEPATYFDISGGFREDRLTTRVDLFSSPCNFEEANKLKLTSITLWQGGVKAQLALCDYWFLKGFAYFSYGHQGKYHERTFAPGSFETVSKARIHRARMRDFQLAFGYLYPVDGVWGCWGVGPVAGWAYNDQHFKMHHAFTDCVPDLVLEGLEYKSRWSGPYLGADVAYRHCTILFTAGFEYHWAWWNGDWLLDGPDIPFVAFSDSRKSKRATGVVFYLDGRWEFYSCWHIGVGLKWQRWEARDGHLEPKLADFDEVGSILGETTTTFVKLRSTRWYSASATLDIGYGF